jgi:hypothetical protein
MLWPDGGGRVVVDHARPPDRPAQAAGQGTMSTTTDELKNTAADVEYVAGHKNMLQLIELRWIAVIGQVTTIAGAMLVFDVHLPLVQMLEVLACLIAFNIASHLRWHEHRPVTNNELFLALLVDVASLTMQLYLSGGTTNPFAFLYLLQVILSAVLLEAWSTWTIVGITLACLAGLSIFARPLALPLRPRARHLQPVRAGHADLLRAERRAAGDVHLAHQQHAARQGGPAGRPAPARRRRRAHRAHGPAGLGRRPRTGHAAGDAVGDPGRLEAHARIQAATPT